MGSYNSVHLIHIRQLSIFTLTISRNHFSKPNSRKMLISLFLTSFLAHPGPFFRSNEPRLPQHVMLWAHTPAWRLKNCIPFDDFQVQEATSILIIKDAKSNFQTQDVCRRKYWDHIHAIWSK